MTVKKTWIPWLLVCAFLLAVPFVAFGTVAFFAVRGKKKLDAEPER